VRQLCRRQLHHQNSLPHSSFSLQALLSVPLQSCQQSRTYPKPHPLHLSSFLPLLQSWNLHLLQNSPHRLCSSHQEHPNLALWCSLVSQAILPTNGTHYTPAEFECQVARCSNRLASQNWSALQCQSSQLPLRPCKPSLRPPL